MATGLTAKGRNWLGLTREDEDILACQLLSAFGWILFVALVNFFVLHKPNTIPEAEAVWIAPPAPTAMPPKPFEQVLALAKPTEDLRRDFLEDEHKPNYYFLYRDQIRFVDRVPEQKVVVASLKPTVPAPEKQKTEKKPEPLAEQIRPRPLEWVDVPLLESRKEQRQPEPVCVDRSNATQERVQVAMVQDLEMDLKIVRDAPPPVTVSETSPAARSRKAPTVAPVDLSMEIVQPADRRHAARAVPVAAPAAMVRPAAAADFVALPMDVASEKGRPAGISVGTGASEKAPSAKPLFSARETEGDVGVSMDLGPGEGRGKPSRSGAEGTIEKEGRSARLFNGNEKSLGGIDLGSGWMVAEKKTEPKPAGPEPARPAARIPLRQGPGQIPLGTPLAFRLGDVGDETNSGSAYLARSTQLKKFLDGRRLPGTAVTVSVEEQGGGASGASEEVVGVSYSRSQIVLQFATGKQQVVTLVPGEPYPRFELRLAAGAASNVPVGTKLEEITACLQTLQRVLKE